MEPETITSFLAIGAIIFIGFFGNMFFNRYRIPDVLLLVMLGMAIGPDVLGQRFGLVTEDALSSIDQFKDMFLSAALVIILFDGGLSLDMKVVMESMRLSVFMSVLTFVAEISLIAVALHLIMGMDLLVSLILGAILGGTTGAIVIPIANRMRIKPQTRSMVIMESVITDVLVIVTALTLISVAKLGVIDPVNVVSELAVKFLVGAVVGFAAGIAWLFVLDRLHNQPLSYMITVAALFVVAGVVELPPVGSSGAVAALAFGLALGNRNFVKRRLPSVKLATLSDDHIHHFHTEITFFVRTFFFVYLGLSFRFETFTWIHLTAGLLVASLTSFTRHMTSTLTQKVGGLGNDDRRTIFALMPKGLSAAVLATLPATQLAGTSIWSADYAPLFLNVTLIVILVTTVIATVLSFRVERNTDRRQRQEMRKRLAEER